MQPNKMQFIVEFISLKQISATFFEMSASDIKLYLDYVNTSFGVKSVIIYSCLQQL